MMNQRAAMTTERDTISKEELGALEAEVLPLPITILDSDSTDDEIREVMSALAQAPVLGLDTETKPSFEKGVTNSVSILQLSDHSRTVIVKLLSFSPEEKKSRLEPVAKILADPNILLVGVSIHDDALELRRDHQLECHQVLELQLVAKAAGLKVFSLSKLYALLYDKRISKSQRLSNWENPTLSDAQSQYAALDAYAGLQIYEGLKDFVRPEMIEKKVVQTPRKSRAVRNQESRRRRRRILGKPKAIKGKGKASGERGKSAQAKVKPAKSKARSPKGKTKSSQSKTEVPSAKTTAKQPRGDEAKKD